MDTGEEKEGAGEIMGGIPSIYPSPYSDVGEGSFRELKVRSNFRAYELGGGGSGDIEGMIAFPLMK